ncbi:hypothetical protein [Methylobacterium planeticum]|uniref:Uncharacterized protein n=1 Tax=Methylobacterium planeticum TaxID=2615211 RepID=A0A6N6MK69_9HYPH|nr:hypothetical protein [Methylobacterium planeticum]KAB1071586.1 hypothetical protein F6X51_18620 [Methylobacterium planeticum]
MAKSPPTGEPDNVVELRPGQLPPADLSAVAALAYIRTLTENLSYASGEKLVDAHLDMIGVLIRKALK